MHQKMLVIVIVCLLVRSEALTVPLSLGRQIQSLRAQIVYCEGMLVCGIKQNPLLCIVECIHAESVCNGKSDCRNGIDEHDCKPMCKDKVMCPDRKTCAVPCDGVRTCGNGEDEMDCPPTCSKPQMLCSDYRTCATACDGEKECPGREDEHNCPPTCLPGSILCADGKTCGRPCDRNVDCPGEGDEMDCPFQCRCRKGEYVCLASNKCLEREFVCEGGGSNPKTRRRRGLGEPDGDDDGDTGSCYNGNQSGDDEDNDGRGTSCNNISG